ncbi:MAG: hypothetical protein IVW56_10565 [Candidatus Binataceae bacterium]|nr:hypothetical protein [Candidatus Binataceae bacterium]
MPETRRDEQKLWLILFQIKAARARLNFLVLQHWLFATLAIALGATALICLAAELLGPLMFLGSAVIVALFALAALIRIARSDLRSGASMAKAARIADERAGLKGRLTTVLMLADAPKPSVLWPYLVEDTYGLREEYAPARIEPRIVSRAVFGLLAALLLFAAAMPFSAIARGGRRRLPASAMGPPGRVSADIDSLEIRPADPALQPNAEIYADPATLRRLEDKLSAAGNPNRGSGQGLGKLINRAREFADAVQNKLTGRNDVNRPPINLRLTARNQDTTVRDHDRPRRPSSSASGKGGGMAGSLPGSEHASTQGPGSSPGQPPITSLPADQADQLAGNNPAGANPAVSPTPPGRAPNPLVGGGQEAGGGANRGSGSDPEHLFGEASNQPVGSDSFKIAIEAEPSTEASAPGSPGYLPPDVRVPLNQDQYPDEPLARAAVPAGDQLTIKRVFER